MTWTSADVARLADTARIHLSEDECSALAPEIEAMLEVARRLSAAASPDVEPMTHPTELTNVQRPDKVHNSLTIEDALSGAPAVEQEQFRVPRILSED